MSRRVVTWSAVSVAVVAGCTAAALVATGVLPPRAEADAPTATTPTSTAEVERGTLTGTTRQSGKLTRPDGPTVGGPITGTITEVPGLGTVLHPRDTLYKVDDQPVTYFDGVLPQWRAFEQGMAKGPDVRQLEANLQSWGYLKVAPDDVFDARTTRAVQAWQKDAGLERTGTVEMGRLVFQTGDLVVADQQAKPGDQAGGAVYATKRTERVVTVDLPVGSSLAAIDTVVQLALPDGTRTTGRVTAVGAPVAKDDGSTKAPVTVTLDDQAAAGDLTDGSVTADFVSQVREDVLFVPVLALGAAADDGFVLEVVQADGSTRAVPVEAGLFAGDDVEVTGDVEAGDRVVVPEAP